MGCNVTWIINLIWHVSENGAPSPMFWPCSLVKLCSNRFRGCLFCRQTHMEHWIILSVVHNWNYVIIQFVRFAARYQGWIECTNTVQYNIVRLVSLPKTAWYFHNKRTCPGVAWSIFRFLLYLLALFLSWIPTDWAPKAWGDRFLRFGWSKSCCYLDAFIGLCLLFRRWLTIGLCVGCVCLQNIVPIHLESKKIWKPKGISDFNQHVRDIWTDHDILYIIRSNMIHHLRCPDDLIIFIISPI